MLVIVLVEGVLIVGWKGGGGGGGRVTMLLPLGDISEWNVVSVMEFLLKSTQGVSRMEYGEAMPLPPILYPNTHIDSLYS